MKQFGACRPGCHWLLSPIKARAASYPLYCALIRGQVDLGVWGKWGIMGDKRFISQGQALTFRGLLGRALFGNSQHPQWGCIRKILSLSEASCCDTRVLRTSASWGEAGCNDWWGNLKVHIFMFPLLFSAANAKHMIISFWPSGGYI